MANVDAVNNVRYDKKSTYKLADSQTISFGDTVYLSSGKVAKFASNGLVDGTCIGIAGETKTSGVLATSGQQEYITVIRAGEIAFNGLKDSGSYTSNIAVGDRVSLKYDSSLGTYNVVKDSTYPIGEVIEGNVDAVTTTTVLLVDMDLTTESVLASEIQTLSDNIVIGTSKRVYFRDTATSIYSSGANVLTLVGPTTTITGATKINLDGPVDVTGVMTLDGTGLANGILISGTTTEAIHITGNATYGVDIETGTFTTGLRVAAATTGLIIGTCTTAISLTGNNTNAISIIGANTTAGLSVTGTTGAAGAKAIRGVMTTNNANYGDGYGLVECDLTLTGTTAGATSALSSWVNIPSGTATGLVCAQTNGVYEDAAATISGATVIFGMRMQSLLAEAAGESYPFSIVSNTNIITAIIQCNDASSDLGRITAEGVSAGTLIPLYKDNTGIKYVKIYRAS